ncbi:MAG: phosphotransferase family protein [Chloroflexi bacterium]|nr:phosphotransferase family protein [Chloroflexota bacterium]
MMSDVVNTLKSRLSAYLTQSGGLPVTIEQAQPIAGGASRDTWLLEATLGGEKQRWVLRRDLPSVMIEHALTREQEYTLIKAAYEHGVRAPRPRFLCSDPAVLGQPFFIMDFVEGVSIGRKVIQSPELAGARAALPEQMAAQLARIHAIDPDANGLGFLPRPRAGFDPAQEALAQARAMLDMLDAHNPAFEFGLRWCEQHAPAAARVTLAHGDFRIGNLLVAAQGLAAVIDWEFGHIGDPLEELGYPCMRDWRFGNGHLHFAGLCERERFLRAYEAESGVQVERAAVDWWEIMGNLRWGATCLAQANRHLSGKDVSVEYASLGRRAAEMQLEMLRLIQARGL